ncbi:hypothetical protein WMO40_16985 [Bacillaceae bacterium CLA-AA-H227]|uniref:Uncharacterized protein n=1 Tax=Robertmurraya yapensis (ex Hitch et al 2024) TaxID=3133160 RepID=A0ACC6SEY8_9BACI
MGTIIPILPCQSIREQVAFYESIGFETVQVYTRPYPYAVVRLKELELHFYGSKKTIPSENPQMCYLKVDDVDKLYEKFTVDLKKNLGKIPRSGIPRISKLKDLADDRRFIITDLGGNTLIVGTPNSQLSDGATFFRTLESKEYAKNFEILYDLIYSKEDGDVANRMLVKFFPLDLTSMDIGEIDLAKILSTLPRRLLPQRRREEMNRIFVSIFKIKRKLKDKVMSI